MKRLFTAALVLLMTVSLCACKTEPPAEPTYPPSPSKLVINDYMVVVTSGEDGQGAIEDIYLDREKILSDFARVFSELDVRTTTNEDGSTIYEYIAKDADRILFRHRSDSLEAANAYLISSHVPDLIYPEDWEQQSHGLHNGDQLTFQRTPDRKDIQILERILGVDVICEDFTYTVEGLN